MAWVKTRTTDDGTKRFVACYRDPEGRQRSAGTYPSHRAALRAANREEGKVREGAWHDHSRGHVTFADYVTTVWLPSKHVETTTLAAYRSYLDKHFLPTFGKVAMGKVLPSQVQRWVTDATEVGLSAASVRKYHTMLSSIFERALRDRVVTFNPCEHTELPKVIKKKARTLTPAEYDAILAALPALHRLMVETAINTGLRWGELIALKPRHLNLETGRLTVQETIVEISRRTPPPGSGCSPSPTPKTTSGGSSGFRPTWSTSSPRTSPTGDSDPTTCCSRPATAPADGRDGTRAPPAAAPCTSARADANGQAWRNVLVPRAA